MSRLPWFDVDYDRHTSPSDSDGSLLAMRSSGQDGEPMTCPKCGAATLIITNPWENYTGGGGHQTLRETCTACGHYATYTNDASRLRRLERLVHDLLKERQ